MTNLEILTMLKARLGISSDIKNTYLTLIIDSAIKMLDDEKGLDADLTNPLICEFIIDYGAWKYEAKGEQSGMPRHLQYSLHNLMIHNQKAVVVVV